MDRLKAIDELKNVIDAYEKFYKSYPNGHRLTYCGSGVIWRCEKCFNTFDVFNDDKYNPPPKISGEWMKYIAMKIETLNCSNCRTPI